MIENDNNREDFITIYRPNQRHELGLLRTWLVMGSNAWKSRELIWQLFKRDFLASYKKSFIGFTWIFIMPILGIASWVFMQKAGLLKPGDVGIPYPAYVLIGTTMWGLFVGFYHSASETLNSGESLVMQVNFPHEALLFKTTAQHIAEFSIAFGVNILVLIMFKVVPSWRIVFFPLVASPLFFLGAAVGLMVSMIGVVAIDVSRVINVLIGFLMFTTPVIYGGTIENHIVASIVKWNPLTYLVCSCRDIIVHGHLYNNNYLAYFLCAALSLILFLISWRLFYVSEHDLIERMI